MGAERSEELLPSFPQPRLEGQHVHQFASRSVHFASPDVFFVLWGLWRTQERSADGKWSCRYAWDRARNKAPTSQPQVLFSTAWSREKKEVSTPDPACIPNSLGIPSGNGAQGLRSISCISCQHINATSPIPYSSLNAGRFFSVLLEISNTSTEGKEIFKFCKSSQETTDSTFSLFKENYTISLPSELPGRVHGTLCWSPSENTVLQFWPLQKRIRILEKQPGLKQDSPFYPWKTATEGKGQDQRCCEWHSHIQHSPESCQSPGALLEQG